MEFNITESKIGKNPVYAHDSLPNADTLFIVFDVLVSYICTPVTTFEPEVQKLMMDVRD